MIVDSGFLCYSVHFISGRPYTLSTTFVCLFVCLLLLERKIETGMISDVTKRVRQDFTLCICPLMCVSLCVHVFERGCARRKSILWEAPEKGAYQPEERLAKEWNMENTQVHWI